MSMKRVMVIAIALFTISISTTQAKEKKAPAAKPKAPKEAVKETVKEPTEIHWLTIQELQAKMAQSPRKVFIDVYTDWCGWCKKMEASTFRNPELVKYVNNNFYCMRLDAERKDSIQFNGKLYYFEPQYRANTLAVELMGGKMSYPTTIFMLENFQNPQPIPGYRDVKEMELFLTFFGDNVFKHQSWDEFQKSFKPVWAKSSVPETLAPPAGH
jgi:thioredoxin-related protein